ncbi:MAG TPA: aldo/keto reductase [Chloroflexi bacterium]|jgi:aryl-alcohol dehydrogenase-like predicted oxidoreductase|nr:aldo/keto reductase [Chloroflexota bacterium]
MQYRDLGRTGVQVSELCLGCMMFGGRTEPQVSMDIIDRAIDAGINFFDTANVYNRGRSEEVVGQALKRNGKRNRIVIATKVHGRMIEDDPNGRGNHRRHIIQQCEDSLRRLQTDWIDVYQLHRPDSGLAIDETLRALDDLIRHGKVRYIGTSTFAAWQLMEALWAAKELGLNRFVTEQPPYHLLDRRIERELVPFAQTYGVALIPWSPLAGGFLTGKYRPGEAPPEGTRLAGRDDPRTRALLAERSYGVLETLQTMAAEKGVTASQLALAWVAQQPAITAPIIGPRTMEQLEDNLGAIEVVITDEDRRRFDEVAPPGRAIAPYYEADFGPHRYRWI